MDMDMQKHGQDNIIMTPKKQKKHKRMSKASDAEEGENDGYDHSTEKIPSALGRSMKRHMPAGELGLEPPQYQQQEEEEENNEQEQEQDHRPKKKYRRF